MQGRMNSNNLVTGKVTQTKNKNKLTKELVKRKGVSHLYDLDRSRNRT